MPRIPIIWLVVPMWQRPQLTRVVFEYYARLRREIAPRVCLRLHAVGSEQARSRSLAEENEWSYVEHPNEPLASKFDALLQRPREHGGDAVIFSGSDDVLTGAYVERCAQDVLAGVDIVGLLDMAFLNLSDWRLIHWPGYSGRRAGEPLGAGRCVSGRLLERIGWSVWDSARDYSDLYMWNRLCQHADGQSIRTYRMEGRVAALDVKAEHGLTNFDNLSRARGVRTLPSGWIRDQFGGDLETALLRVRGRGERGEGARNEG